MAKLVDRRTFFKGAGVVAAAAATGSLGGSTTARASDSPPSRSQLTTGVPGVVIDYADGGVRVRMPDGNIAVLTPRHVDNAWKWRTGDRVFVETDLATGALGAAPLVVVEHGRVSLNGDEATVNSRDARFRTTRTRDAVSQNRNQMVLIVENTVGDVSAVFGVR
jgi:TAT (twin-arginine translocation) pathway signal sequence